MGEFIQKHLKLFFQGLKLCMPRKNQKKSDLFENAFADFLSNVHH